MKQKKKFLFYLIGCLMSGLIFSTQLYAKMERPDRLFKGVVKKTISSTILNEQRTLYIHCPKNYQQGKFPVLFMLDAGIGFVYGQSLKATRQMPHIIIGIDTKRNRNRDMIPTVSPRQPGSGAAETFLRFIREELIPYVDRHYPNNGTRTLCGGSASGLFTLYALLKSPDSFTAYISGSPAIGYSVDKMGQLVRDAAGKCQLRGKKLFLAYGDKERFPPTIRFIPDFADLMKKRLGDQLLMRITRLPGRHVPIGFLKRGLEFASKAGE